jgi:hypothetical protein
MLSSGARHRVDPVETDVSEELVASILRVDILEPHVPPK